MLSGCDTVAFAPKTTMLVPIADGEKIEVTYSNSNGAVIMEAKAGVQIELATLVPSDDKKHITYVFKLSVKNGVAPKRVTVSDLTDVPERILVDDQAPRLDNGHWNSAKVDRGILDPSLAWLSNVDDSIRIYRFKVTLADGSQAVLDQPSVFPGGLKAVIRKVFGLDY